MKNSLLYYVLPLLFFFFACNNSSSDSEKKAKEENREKINSQIKSNRSADTPNVVLSKADADFMVEAASGGMKEVALGQLALTNSKNTQVKAFGNMMVQDHGASGDKLKALAAAKNITLPDAISNAQQKEKERLQKKKGLEFDLAYISIMSGDHKRDIREFEKAAKNTTDSDIKAFAAGNLPMLYKHLDSLKHLQTKLGISDQPIQTPIYP